jgi:thymidylate synthase ThyX
MTISAKVILDSTHHKDRLITLELEYPRYIHPEMMSHRVYSRNAQSSRAIPVEKSIKAVEESTWYPIFMMNKKGMAASDKVGIADIDEVMFWWDAAKQDAIYAATKLMELGVHKQIVNRLLEPFSTIKVVLSSTDFSNFFSLRIAEGAQQEMQELAYKMKEAINSSHSSNLDVGQWHTPYLREEEEDLPAANRVALSAARCARVSYLTHDGLRDPTRDYSLHDQLVSERHMSPFEHQATPGLSDRYYANFKGWIQYRKHIENGWKLK